MNAWPIQIAWKTKHSEPCAPRVTPSNLVTHVWELLWHSSAPEMFRGNCALKSTVKSKTDAREGRTWVGLRSRPTTTVSEPTHISIAAIGAAAANADFVPHC